MNTSKLAKLLMTAALLLCCMTTEAIPVMPGQWATLKLADGTTVRAEVCGNEFGTWYQDAEGQCYTKQGDVYVVTPWETIAARRQAAIASRAPRRVIQASTGSGLGSKGRNSGGSMYSVGEYEIPVLMVEFSDTKFQAETTTDLVQDYLTKEGFTYEGQGVGSIRDYFVAQSQGMFKPNFKLLGKVTVDKPFSYYGKNNPNDPDDSDVLAYQLPGDAMRAALQQLPGVDFKKYVVAKKDDLHKDGIPPAVHAVCRRGRVEPL